MDDYSPWHMHATFGCMLSQVGLLSNFLVLQAHKSVVVSPRALCMSSCMLLLHVKHLQLQSLLEHFEAQSMNTAHWQHRMILCKRFQPGICAHDALIDDLTVSMWLLHVKSTLTRRWW